MTALDATPVSARDATIRHARLGDASEITRLAAQLGNRISSAKMERRLGCLLADCRHHVVVASVRDGQLLGWLHIEHRLSLESAGRAELMGLVVAPAARRRGIGRELVNEAERWASAKGLAELRVRSNTARNASHPFYEALGYMRGKTQHVYSKAIADRWCNMRAGSVRG